MNSQVSVNKSSKFQSTYKPIPLVRNSSNFPKGAYNQHAMLQQDLDASLDLTNLSKKYSYNKMQNNLDSLRKSQHIQSEPMEYMRTIQNSPVSKYDARIFYKKETARNIVNAKSIQRTPNSKFNDLMSRKKGIQNERNQLIYGSKEGLISQTLSPN